MENVTIQFLIKAGKEIADLLDEKESYHNYHSNSRESRIYNVGSCFSVVSILVSEHKS